MTPSSTQGAGAAPLMGTAGVTGLFFPAIEETEERAADAPAAADRRAPEQRLWTRPGGAGVHKENQCLTDASPAEEAHANDPGPKGCSGEGAACAVEAQTPPTAEAAPPGDGGALAAAGVDSMVAGESEERSPAGGALAIVVSLQLTTRHCNEQKLLPSLGWYHA